MNVNSTNQFSSTRTALTAASMPMRAVRPRGNTKGTYMKKTALITVALALGLAAVNTIAQDAGGAPPRGDGPPPRDDGAPGDARPPGGPGRGGVRPPISPLEEALDAAPDGIISA